MYLDGIWLKKQFLNNRECSICNPCGRCFQKNQISFHGKYQYSRLHISSVIHLKLIALIYTVLGFPFYAPMLVWEVGFQLLEIIFGLLNAFYVPVVTEL